MKSPDFLRESSGLSSSYRVIFVMWGVVPLLVWALLSVKAGEFLPLPPEYLYLMGLLITGKLVQKPLEEKKAPEN